MRVQKEREGGQVIPYICVPSRTSANLCFWGRTGGPSYYGCNTRRHSLPTTFTPCNGTGSTISIHPSPDGTAFPVTPPLPTRGGWIEESSRISLTHTGSSSCQDFEISPSGVSLRKSQTPPIPEVVGVVLGAIVPQPSPSDVRLSRTLYPSPGRLSSPPLHGKRGGLIT